MEISDEEEVLRISLRRDCINVGCDVLAPALRLLLPLLVSSAEGVMVAANRRVGRLNLGVSEAGAAEDVEGRLEASLSRSSTF